MAQSGERKEVSTESKDRCHKIGTDVSQKGQVQHLDGDERLVVIIKGKEVLKITRENRVRAILVTLLLAVLVAAATEIAGDYVHTHVLPVLREVDFRSWLEWLLARMRQHLTEALR